MRRRLVVAIAAATVVGTGAVVVNGAADAAPVAPQQAAQAAADHADEVVSPLEEKRRALRQEGLAKVLSGEASAEKRGASTVVKVGTAASAKNKSTGKKGVDQYVELAREKTDKIFVVLAEFGDERHPDFPDKDTNPNVPGPARYDGPRHNQIAKPNRAVDNKTIWQADYSKKHFEDMYFAQGANTESLKTFYEKASSGRYSVEGQVTDWVKVKYNEARYGRSDGYPCPGRICGNSWYLVSDALQQWVTDRKAAGATDASIKADLASYDTWDRYDFDGDGDFNEPDGYLDHFQIVHAGGDQSDADPAQGEDAIWAHRWYAFSSNTTGPVNNKLGGVQIGTTGLWVGDYTMQPENGGLGVFAHEYGHDLGLPDHYDTVGPGGAQENGINWWSLMGQSRVSNTNEAIGLRANDLSAWDKLQLGWLDYETVVAGQDKKIDLGPGAYNTDKAQGVVVVLPDKQVSTSYGTPFAGTKMWWSSKGDNLSNSLTRSVNLTGKTSAELKLKARYDIEDCDCDFLFVEASTDGGANWTALDGVANGKPFTRDAVGTPAITNTTNNAWVDVAVPLTSLAGKDAQIRLRYRTDGGVALDGFFADEISVVADGAPLFTDGAEAGNNGWTPAGFRITTGTETANYDHFYVASNRTYTGYDKYLQPGPYDYGDPSRPNWATRFPYQDGLLVTYWDTSQPDNNASVHPGEGLLSVVDSHPEPIYNLQGQAWRPRVAGYDAPFSLQKSDSFTLYAGGRASYIRGTEAQPLFDDTKSYFNAAQPTAGVKLPAAGVSIKVLKQEGTSLQIRVFPSKKK
ncbi:immune inhibitor A domain-containing protein [Actinokineospora diospyrosa]|uniref:Immune inhibitor A n=1 Tax=Actinokineospora diospyrosa TaxID=103728 RepID=A0ABT1IF67_9PSEU|nr:immune inhibitor A domain-containing protein [Actinokineospora diospyrosa]MCP2271277.1 immune inhibitor A [Actinokineospora diospyrosa]